MSSITLLTSAGAVRVAGDNLVIDIRDIPETPATSSQPVTAACEATPPASQATIPSPAVSAGADGHRGTPRTDARDAGPADVEALAVGKSQSDQAVSNSHSAPSKAETGRAGGPVCEPVANQEPAERPSGAICTDVFVSSSRLAASGVPHSIPHKSGKLKVQPANLSDPRDPGPIPSFMDRRAKKDVAA